MNGNSIYIARYGVPCRTSDLVHILSSCQKYIYRIKSNIIGCKQEKCHTCLQWDAMPNAKLSKTNPPKSYPKDELYHIKKIEPVEISWKVLRIEINKASDALLTEIWSDTNCRCNLSTYGLNNNASDKVIIHCNNIKASSLANAIGKIRKVLN